MTVFTEEGDSVTQPHTFQCCPLGMQFYSRKRFEECSVFEFRMDLPPDAEGTTDITCHGLVVNCRHEETPGMYRVWVKFLNLPQGAQRRIHCLAKSSEFLCPFCENF